MADASEPDRQSLTFAQAEGKEPLPAPLALGELSAKARAALWQVVHFWFKAQTYDDGWEGGPRLIGSADAILHAHFVHQAHEPDDEFTADLGFWINRLKPIFFQGEFFAVLGFLQDSVMRHRDCPQGFAYNVNGALEGSFAAYGVSSDGKTIFPKATPEEGRAIKKAFADLAAAKFGGALEHLRSASDAINGGDWAGAVRESINTVEAVARLIDEKSSTGLRPALESLERSAKIHPALKNGFISIYGWTSDEGGIRHALLEDEAKVDSTDAVFMFGACASFVSYLIARGRAAGLIK